MSGAAGGDEGAGDAPLLDDVVDAPRRSAIIVAPATAGVRRAPFDRDRLRDSVEAARRAGGASTSEPASLAEEVADIVAFTLRARAESAGGDAAGALRSDGALVVAEEEVGRLVERALIEVGAAATARAYIVARDRGARARSAARDTGPTGGPRLPMVRGATGPEPFGAHRIVAALIEETGLLPEQAEAVAVRVADTLRGAGLPSVSTALVRELVSNELLGLGHRDALRRHEAIGVPRHDLTRIFERSGAGPTDAFDRRVAREVVGRWAAADHLASAAADAHARGDIEVVALGEFHAPIARAVEVDLLASDRGGAAGRARLLRAAADVARGTAEGLTIEGLVGAGDDDPAGLLETLGAVGGALGRPISLSRPDLGDGGASAAGWLDAVADVTASGPHAPRLHLTFEEAVTLLCTGDGGDATAAAAASAERALERGSLVPVWSSVEGRAWAGPGLTRRVGQRSGRGALALDAAVAVNLPRLARRAGPWREDAFFEGVHGVLQVALRALQDRARFVARARRTASAGLSEQPAGAIVPVGLREALRILGDGLARADQGARVLGFLGEAVGRLASASEVTGVSLTPAFGAAAAERFARLDALLARGARQPRLFGDLPRPEEDVDAAYGVGYGDLAAPIDERRVGARAEALGVLLGTAPAGALLGGAVAPAGEGPRGRGDAAPFDAADSSGVEAPDELLEILPKHPRLAAWGRFAAIRASGAQDAMEPPGTTLF